jgi:hypothetical protein
VEFASNNAVSETTGVSPFFANYRFNPRLGTEPSKPCPLNLSYAQRYQFYKANVVADRFERIITQLKALAQQSVSKYKDYANRHREDTLHYEEGQRVFVDTRNMKINCTMKKGDDKIAGSYRILKVYLHACLLELLAETKCKGLDKWFAHKCTGN